MKKPYVIWGSGGHARVVHDALHADWNLLALFDRQAVAPAVSGCPLFVGSDGLREWCDAYGPVDAIGFVIAIGASGEDRLGLQDQFKRLGMQAIQVQHASAVVAHNAQIGEGCHLLAGTVVGANARLGPGVIVNTSASIDHDCVIGPGVHAAPGVRIAGNVTVGAHTFLGIGAIVLPWLTIGEGAVVGAGSVVTRNVEARTKVMGTPARAVPSNG